MNAVEAKGMVRQFGTVTALDGLSFEIHAGELYGLVGPDGAGKTTAIRALAGLIELTRGTARIHGADPTDRDVRERLGLMPQQYSLYGDLSVGENLRFFSRLYALPRATFKKRAERLLAITRLGPFLDRPAAALSGGMYKKLALACALLHEPEVLLLDEPTNGVDPVSRRELWALLYEFVTGGMAVLISTPYMDEAERCHRIGLLHHGRLLLEGQPHALIASFEHEAYEIRGGDREKIEAVLVSLSCVFASSPAGSRLRIVASRGSMRTIENAVAPLGAALLRVAPDFEDLYLARLREEAA
jgi:ABC-2 type transport system ATP-binding protein